MRRQHTRRLMALGLTTLLVTIGSSKANGQVQEIYGVPLPSSDIVFCIDYSASVTHGVDWMGTLAEIEDTLGQLTPGNRFSIVKFRYIAEIFDPDLVSATPEAIEAAIAFLWDMPSDATCLLNGLVPALDIASTGTVGDRSVVLIGDGGIGCDATSDIPEGTFMPQLLAANPFMVPIHAIQTVDSPTASWPAYPTIALATGGLYVVGFGRPFVRGDANNTGVVDIADVVAILESLGGFPSGSYPCSNARDADADGVLDPIADSLFLLSALFLGVPMAWPYAPHCGQDLSATALHCFMAACP